MRVPVRVAGQPQPRLPWFPASCYMANKGMDKKSQIFLKNLELNGQKVPEELERLWPSLGALRGSGSSSLLQCFGTVQNCAAL